MGFYTESVDIWGIGLINAFCKFGEDFFKKDRKGDSALGMKMSKDDEDEDLSDSEDDEEEESRERFAEKTQLYFAKNPNLSEDYRKLSLSLLDIEPENRPKASEIIQSKWIKTHLLYKEMGEELAKMSISEPINIK